MIEMMRYLLRYQLKKGISKKNIWVFCFFVFLLGDLYLRPTRRLIALLGVMPRTTAFSLIWNNTFFLMLFYFNVILYFSDVPFDDAMKPFTLIRCGRTRYALSHILYIICSGIGISGIFFAVQWMILPAPVFGEWGKFWGTMAQTNAGYQVGSGMKVPYHILWEYTPAETLAITFVFSVLLNILTGLFLYFFSLWEQRIPGMCMAAVLAILPHIVSWLNYTTFYWLSPYSWLCLDTTMRKYNGILPSLSYAVTALLLLNGLLLLGIWMRVCWKKDISGGV